MKKTILLILFPLLFNAQTPVTDKSDIYHFYGSLALNLTAYNAQRLILPKQRVSWRLFNSFVFSGLVGLGKELHDIKRDNMPVKLKNIKVSDILVNFMGNGTAFQIQVVINDQKRKKNINYELY
jgi:hypothetical protein